MVFTTPRTFVAGEVETATIFNVHLRDNMNAVRDYMLGAQDLGSNWKVLGGRNVSFEDTVNVSHGMTTLTTTGTYGIISKHGSTQGGLAFSAFSDTNFAAMGFYGYVGSTTPSAPAFYHYGAKANGTGAQALATTEPHTQWVNFGTSLGVWYGAGLNIVGGLTVGYSGVPAAARLYLGDTNFNLYLNTTVPTITVDTGQDEITYDRGNDEFYLTIGGGVSTIIGDTGIRMANGGISLGPAEMPRAGVLTLTEQADPTAPSADNALLYCKDNGAGKTQIVARFPTGAVQLIAQQP